MKSEKGTNRLTGEQIRTRKNSRIIIRILGLSIAVFGIFAFIGFFTNPEFGPNSPGTWIYLLTALFFGGGLFALSFFVPKLYLPSETEKTQRTDPSSDRSSALWQKVDSELAAIEGTHTGSLHEPAPVQEHRQTYSCARCKKQLSEQDCVWVGNHRFCQDCARAPERVFPEAERYHEPKPRTEQSSADRTMKPYPPDGTCDPKDREKKCSRCGREMSGFGLTIRDDGYRLCRQCRETLKRFQVFHYSFNPCPQYLEYEELNVYVADTSYLLLLEGAASSAGETFATLPFGSFAKFSAAQIAEKLNSISPGGFGISKRFRLSADDILDNEDVRALIDYDRACCSRMRFSGGGYGDSVALRIQPDNTVMVECVNDGNGNRFASGGYSLPMPQDLADNYDQSRFIEWLQAHFWYGGPIEINHPAEEEVVKRFLSERRNLYRTSEPTNTEPQFPSVEGVVLPFHTDDGKQMTFRLAAVQHDSSLAGSTMGTSRSTWLFLSYAEEAPFLLEYEYNSEGVGWFAYPLSKEDVQKIKQGPSQGEQKKNSAFWLWEKIVWAHLNNKDMVRFLRPDDLAAAKTVLYPLHTWHGKLTDEEIMGDPPARPAPEQEKGTDG